MKVLREIAPRMAGWEYLTCRTLALGEGETFGYTNATEETLLVVVEGSVSLSGSLNELIGRADPFREVASVAYLPPRAPVQILAHTHAELAFGSAPAEGRYDARLVTPKDMTGEVRGGGNATRQVINTFAPPVEAERIISYEAWLPRGCWTGWPPHRHDGVDASPYLEETYYYRFDNSTGFGVHRNFDPSQGFDELTPLEDRSLVPVPKGYHLCAAGPSSNVWILNFLAGHAEDRERPPHVDPKETWITDDWSAGALALPAVTLTGQPLSRGRV